ncbi:MAG: type I glyceraldehyde-3-phosphate dehydrogenase [Chloroflexota bacterium]|mgnify:CR=1 FL=1|nr:MAG: type I glyceraldehyde-3-phosphate dehydrogenase [Chloroflexota bacterium]
MAVKVGINGLGRIGRATLKVILDDTPDLDLVAVNDIGSLENMAYLLKYDTVYGRYHRSVETRADKLIVGGKEIAFLSERDPANLPWGELGVELVFECTGIFTNREDAAKHIHAGAKWVILSGPTKSKDVPTVVHGVNRGDSDKYILSCASCTTNNIAPVIEIMNRHLGVEKAIMTTVHAYTASQSLVDSPGGKSDMRRGRAAAANFVPSSTGAAIATTKAIPELEGLFDGVSIRGPVTCGSIADVVMLTRRDTTVEEVNDIFRQEAASERYQGILGVTEDALVSSDILMDPRASIVQLDMTRVVAGNLVKIMSWYDNEWGFTNQMIRTALAALGLREPAVG